MNAATASWRLADRFDSGERLREPLAQEARAHRGDGAVERAVERGGAGGIAMERLQHFEMAQRGGIEREEIACAGRSSGA
jgi:hypothetical protein